MLTYMQQRSLQQASNAANKLHQRNSDSNPSCELNSNSQVLSDLDMPIALRKAILEEMNALEKNQTWKVVNLPKGKSTVGCKDLKEEVYMDPPLGFFEKVGSNACKLQKSLHGLKQLPRAWFEKFTMAVNRQGYRQSQADHTMFTRVSVKGKIIVLIVYVDDIILTGDDLVEMDRLKQSLATDFEIKDLGALKYFLRMEVVHSKKGIVVSQRKYILDLLKETRMSGCKPVDTHVEYNLKLGEGEKALVDPRRYQNLVGKLIYLSHTRPDIAFAVSIISRFMYHPREEYLEAVYIILRYLKSTLGKGLLFRKTKNRCIEVYTDANWASLVTDRKSTTG
ncbi:hypothetical protein KPL70_014403 [Citrus sinensis]|nr:hypothetical protein KPL70_014403 [Citrus sinensis]